MKKIKLLVLFLIITLILLIENISYGSNEDKNQKLLYQDITINIDGSITVKEAMWLNGNYNGANREIEFKRWNSYSFTGIYSNFSGDTNIYDATEVTNIRVFDISQSNFKSINDIKNIENEFKEVEKASKGKYGVYTVKQSDYDTEVSIYCPSKKQKVFYLEYTIKDAVVVHNDVAELYWCFLENKSSETILDYQAIVHLPQEDTNVMVWSHGPATGSCSIVDYKTLSLTDTSIAPYKFETLRIMFDKSIVSKAIKNSNVNGKEYIIRYENAMANPEISIEETEKINIENQLSDAFIELDEKPSIFLYNIADELIQRITWSDELKQEYQYNLENAKESVNQSWKESVDFEFYWIEKYNDLSQTKLNYLIREIDEGFDEEAKAEYYAKANEFQNLLNEKKHAIKQKILQIIFIAYYILGIICILVLLKIIFERKAYYKKYYRDFPSEDNAYIIDYLMNKKVTTKTFSVTILDLIAKKIIKLEKNSSVEKDFCFIKQEGNFSITKVESTVIDMLFEVVGNNGKCSLKSLKNYGKTTWSSTIIKYFSKFEEYILKEVEKKKYFKRDNKFSNILKRLPIIVCIISYILGFFINNNGYISLLNYYIIITLLSILYYIILLSDKRRTKKGKLEYSKWLAHKRFLKDFGSFNQKELPEIILWDKYLVTATVLGYSDKVSKQIQIYINSSEGMEEMQDFLRDYMCYQEMKQIKRTIHSYMSKAKMDSTRKSSSSSSRGSSYSSGSGFRGGSSGGGSGGGGGGWSRF